MTPEPVISAIVIGLFLLGGCIGWRHGLRGIAPRLVWTVLGLAASGGACWFIGAAQAGGHGHYLAGLIGLVMALAIADLTVGLLLGAAIGLGLRHRAARQGEALPSPSSIRALDLWFLLSLGIVGIVLSLLE